uniref:Rab-GAP TBC domain-containing protein n=1 Tax=Canis lupus familiaris TaxID=9615 RepID=A0A8P0TQW8_CANLF
MLKRWDHYLPSEKLRCRVYKGVLPQVRGQVWLRLLNVDQEMKEAALASSRDIMQIDLDVNRTFRSHTMFWDRYGVGQRALFHVLAAYSVYDTEVGYCQGMSEIAAIVLMFLPENAFWALAQLMTDDRHAMHGRGPPGRRAGEELRRASLQAAAPGGRRGPPQPAPSTGKSPASPVASGSRSHGHPPHRLQARLAVPLLPQPPARLPAPQAPLPAHSHTGPRGQHLPLPGAPSLTPKPHRGPCTPITLPMAYTRCPSGLGTRLSPRRPLQERGCWVSRAWSSAPSPRPAGSL